MTTFKQCILIFAIVLFLPFNTFSQSKANLEITDIQFRKDSLLVDIFFSIRDGGGRINIEKVYEDLRIEERRVDKTLVMNKLGFANLKTLREEGSEDPDSPGGHGKVSKEQMTISIAFDYSGSMSSADRLEKAKKAVKAVFEIGLPDGSIWFSTFNHNISPKRILTPSNYEEVVGSLRKHKKPLQFETNLRGVVVQKLKELQNSQIEGKKVLIIITDGLHDLKRHPKIDEVTPKEPEVLEWASKTDLAIYTIGISSAVSSRDKFLKDIPRLTPNPNDKYLYSSFPGDLADMLSDVIESASADNKITLRSNFKVYKGLNRKVTLRLSKGDIDVFDVATYRAGGDTKQLVMPEINEDGQIIIPNQSSNILISILTGIIVLILIFICSVIIYPALMKRAFNRKNVIKYKQTKEDKENNATQACPACGDPVQEGEEVVKKCQHIQHKSCWEEEPYPNECIVRCGAKFKKGFKVSDFFDQKGETVHLNWMFFGALAMFIAYIIISAIGDANAEFTNLIMSLLETITPNTFADEKIFLEYIRDNDLSKYYSNTLDGIFIGAMLGLAFSYLEEKRNQMFFKTYLKILLRTIVMGIVGFVIFFVGSMLSSAIDMDYISQLIMWLLFGLVFGYALSVKTSISPKNGIIGGLLSSAIAFQPFFFVIKYVGMSEVSRILSFIIYGAILGSIISVVNKMLSKYVLKIIQVPVGSEKWKNVDVKIHKWMNASQSVSLGSSVDNHFSIHWEKDIPAQSIQLEKKNEKVFIYVLNGSDTKPIKLNNRILTEGAERQIFKDDIIEVGDTKFQYVEE